MWNDVVDLRDFYVSSLGRVARRMIARQLRSAWSDVHGMAVLGLGYATPFLRSFRGEAERVLAAMPSSQGVLAWPADGRRLTTLTEEQNLPFPDLSMDRVLLVHAFERSERVRPMMREVWRVLAGGGRLMVVVPNRRGMWAHFERTPFGHGQPYTEGQLSRSLRELMFTPLESHSALYVPPVRSRMILSSAGAWEELGLRWFTTFAGVIMIEATKQLYAGQTEAAAEAAYIPLAHRNPGASVR